VTAVHTAVNDWVRLVAVDGMDDIGKTTLSNKVGAALGAVVVHLDDFVQKNEGGRYVEFIDLESLGQALESGMSCFRCVLVAGVCVLAILDQLGISPVFHVYVKELMFGYCWQHKDRLHGSADTLEAKLAYEDELNQAFAELDLEAEGLASDILRRYLIRYHWRYRPDENATLVFGIKKHN